MFFPIRRQPHTVNAMVRRRSSTSQCLMFSYGINIFGRVSSVALCIDRLPRSPVEENGGTSPLGITSATAITSTTGRMGETDQGSQFADPTYPFAFPADSDPSMIERDPNRLIPGQIAPDPSDPSDPYQKKGKTGTGGSNGSYGCLRCVKSLWCPRFAILPSFRSPFCEQILIYCSPAFVSFKRPSENPPARP